MLKQASERRFKGRVEVYVDKDLKQRFKDACDARGLTMLEAMESMMEQFTRRA